MNTEAIKKELSNTGISTYCDENDSPSLRVGKMYIFKKTIGGHERELKVYPEKRHFKDEVDLSNFVKDHFKNLMV